MSDQRLDEIEARRLLTRGFADARELRDAIELVVNGERLSEVLDGVALNASEVRELLPSWVRAGRGVTVVRCGCGDVGCLGVTADIDVTGTVVEWTIRPTGQVLRFAAHDLEREVRRALNEPGVRRRTSSGGARG